MDLKKLARFLLVCLVCFNQPPGYGKVFVPSGRLSAGFRGQTVSIPVGNICSVSCDILQRCSTSLSTCLSRNKAAGQVWIAGT